jgi:hypothetical protein
MNAAEGSSSESRPFPAWLEVVLPSEEVSRRTGLVYEGVMSRSSWLSQGNFSSIAPADLERLFDLYEEHFFAGHLRSLIDQAGSSLSFFLSRRLTRAAGITKRLQHRPPRGQPTPPPHYEITISTTLLFQTFHDVDRTVRVGGLVCRDRLEALQRIFEHELIHLTEMLLWGKSSCSRPPFKRLAEGLFGHTQTNHDLVTQLERASSQFGILPGDRVRFVFEGTPQVGVVNRITRRATILVESPAGPIYSDGVRYLKFYVPLNLLEKL